jgi:hypothetical protein
MTICTLDLPASREKKKSGWDARNDGFMAWGFHGNTFEDKENSPLIERKGKSVRICVQSVGSVVKKRENKPACLPFSRKAAKAPRSR